MILMKKITNEYFSKFCDVIERSLTDHSKFELCLKDMKDASLDDDHRDYVYKDTNCNMVVIKLDEYTKDFIIMRRKEQPEVKDHQPKAVDAVCVNKSNEWFLIEFKNQPLDSALKDITKKMASSFWLIAFLYSRLSEKMTDESDLLKFAREHVTFIAVVSSSQNVDYECAIGASWDEKGPFYTPNKFLKYRGYYFKDAYVLTEKGLRHFIKKFDE